MKIKSTLGINNYISNYLIYKYDKLYIVDNNIFLCNITTLVNNFNLQFIMITIINILKKNFKFPKSYKQSL